MKILLKYRLASKLRLKLIYKEGVGYYVVVHQAAMIFGGYKHFDRLGEAREFYDAIIADDQKRAASGRALNLQPSMN